MTAFVLIKTPVADAEALSEQIWELPGILGIEELPADGQLVFRPDLDHHFVRFDGRSQYNAWLRTEEYRRGDHVLLKVYYTGEFPETFAVIGRGTVEPEDYLAQMRDQHHGRVIGKFWVGPPWESPRRTSFQLVSANEQDARSTIPVIIEPGTAFGLGDHPTTQLCLELLASIPRPRRVLDFGAGSGVLAIAAAKLWPGCELCLTELDQQCWSNIESNFALNGLPAPPVHADVPAGKFDLILANIYLEVLKSSVLKLDAKQLILSGILGAEQLTEFKRHLAGWRIIRQLEREDWFALQLERC
ncbi:MAG: 50S ribosomal protein L11 methyltransferase [Verrucomicrobiota bacterium]